MTITLDWLHARCKEEGDCLIWQGAVDNNGRDPRTRENGKRVYVRRIVWAAARNRQPAEGFFVGTTCGTQCCVCPDHLILRTRSQAIAGHKKGADTRRRIALGKRLDSKLSDAAVAAIRQDTRVHRLIAADHGCSKSMVRLIKNGTARRDYSSPFAGLLA